jgi:hypothetical protein
MTDYDYDDKFPLGLSHEEKAALIWKIEQDYRSSDRGAVSFKDAYITFAVSFYTRNRYGLEDVVVQYRAHCAAEKRKALAQAFLTDMKHNMRQREFEALM